MTLDPWLMLLVGVLAVIGIAKFIIAFDKRDLRREARKRNQAHPWK